MRQYQHDAREHARVPQVLKGDVPFPVAQKHLELQLELSHPTHFLL
jgi:hypothetical protein